MEKPMNRRIVLPLVILSMAALLGVAALLVAMQSSPHSDGPQKDGPQKSVKDAQTQGLKPTFKSDKRDVPNAHYYVVVMTYDGDDVVLIEVKNDAGGFTMQKRAE